MGQRAEEATATYLVNEQSLGSPVCSVQSEMPCYPGDQPCLDAWNSASAAAADIGCIPEDLALTSCLSTLTADGFECGAGYPTQTTRVCVSETAESAECFRRDIHMDELAQQICGLQAELPCAAAPEVCVNGIRSESSQYGNIGCGVLREQLLVCLASLNQDDFECSGAGGILAPTVAGGLDGLCGQAQADLDSCACSTGTGGSGGLSGSGGVGGVPLTTGGSGGGAAGTGPCATLTCSGPFRCCSSLYPYVTRPVCIAQCTLTSQECPTPAC